MSGVPLGRSRTAARAGRVLQLSLRAQTPARLRFAFRTPPALPLRVLPAAVRSRGLLYAAALRRLLHCVALGTAPAAARRRPA